MKNIIIAVLSMCLVFLFVSCTKDELPVERSIDGIAEYLGYSNGEDVDLNEDFNGIGAKACKCFEKNGIGVYIYEFDPKSSIYKSWEESTDTCVDGFVLLYDFESDEDAESPELLEELDKLQDIEFEP